MSLTWDFGGSSTVVGTAEVDPIVALPCFVFSNPDTAAKGVIFPVRIKYSRWDSPSFWAEDVDVDGPKDTHRE